MRHHDDIALYVQLDFKSTVITSHTIREEESDDDDDDGGSSGFIHLSIISIKKPFQVILLRNDAEYKTPPPHIQITLKRHSTIFSERILRSHSLASRIE